MSFEEKQGYLLNELLRRLSNIIRIGTICEIDYQKAKARVKTGELKTAYLPWITSNAGENINWNPPSLNEQVMVLSPNGELNRGVILQSLYQNSSPASSNSKDKQKIVFGDGSVFEYDKEAKNFSMDLKGTANINIKGLASISAETVNITAKINTINGKTIINGDTTINGNANISGEVLLAGEGGAVARAGDLVSVDPITHMGKIDSGSEKVKSG